MSTEITKDTPATEGCAAVIGYVDDPLLTAVRNVLERVTDLRSACAERGQHVVACKLDEAYYELRSAVGAWNHTISHTAIGEARADSATLPQDQTF